MTVEEWKLDAFEWLSIDRWTPEYLLSDFTVSEKRYCKVCDSWVSQADEKKHVASHVKQWRDVKKKKAAAAKKAREEGKKRAAEERKRLKEHGLL